MSADISNFVATKRDMIERLVVIDSVDPVIFYGVNNSNMQLIRSLFPKLRVAARGTLIKVLGDEQETAAFEKKIKELEDYCSKYNQLGEEVILDVVKGKPPKELKMDDVIIYGVNGKPIQGRSSNQQKLVKAFQENDLTFALGPAGTGKTYVAIALAVRALKNREVRKVILSRPAVEAGEKRIPSRRYEGQDRPLSAASLRCAGGYDSAGETEGIYGNRSDSDCAVGIYARTHPERSRDNP